MHVNAVFLTLDTSPEVTVHNKVMRDVVQNVERQNVRSKEDGGNIWKDVRVKDRSSERGRLRVYILRFLVCTTHVCICVCLGVCVSGVFQFCYVS